MLSNQFIDSKTSSTLHNPQNPTISKLRVQKGKRSKQQTKGIRMGKGVSTHLQEHMDMNFGHYVFRSLFLLTLPLLILLILSNCFFLVYLSNYLFLILFKVCVLSLAGLDPFWALFAHLGPIIMYVKSYQANYY